MIQFVYFDRQTDTQVVQTRSITVHALYSKVSEKDKMKLTM